MKVVNAHKINLLECCDHKQIQTLQERSEYLGVDRNVYQSILLYKVLNK